MCGIFGYAGRDFSPRILLEGVRRLEYRGYDSWGMAVGKDGGIRLHRAAGRIPESLPGGFAVPGAGCGIAHTRWATHGAPTERNAHPHIDCTASLALVHNGIIENYRPLRRRLEELGHVFRSDTDSEAAVHLVEQLLKEGLDLRLSFLEALKSIEGTYGMALVSAREPGKIFIGRMGSPIVIGCGEGFTVAASDVSAVAPYSRTVAYLDDGECAELSAGGFESFKLDETPVVKQVEKLTFDLEAIELGGYDHFMQKEIHEQPETIRNTMRGRLLPDEGTVQLGGIDDSLLLRAGRLKIIACGTSWHAGLIGKYMFERLAEIPVEVCYAAEFRYSRPVLEPDTLVIAISQSGETADTLAGVREAKSRGAATMGIVNVVGSSIARECGRGIFLHAGPEIGVASTKAFTSQVVVLALLAVQAGRLRGRMSPAEGKAYIEALKRLGDQVSLVLEKDGEIESIAAEYADYTNFLYVGRLFEYPLALEGALKLKEISYIHAEGIPAAELKHGPIALVDRNMPVVVLAAQTGTLDKMVSNVNEIRARGGRIIAIVREGSRDFHNLAEHVVTIPVTPDPLVPVLGAVPLQLLAYHIAVMRGCDVDRPRNLAKSVTVE